MTAGEAIGEVVGEPRTTRAAYVAFLRQHHPDRGGDVDAFVAGLAEVRVAYRASAHQPDRYDAPIVVVVRPRGLRALSHRIRRWRDRRFRKPRVR